MVLLSFCNSFSLILLNMVSNTISMKHASTCTRPFRLTRAIAHACVSTRANLSARAICRTHEKSYSAEKVLFIEYSSFNNPLFMRHLWIIWYMSIAYRRRWLRRPEDRPKRKIDFVGFLRVGFQFQYFFENRQACTVYYININVKFLPFV